jgi:hypothetical protein
MTWSRTGISLSANHAETRLEITMAKGQMRSNKEAKKPKADKAKKTAATSVDPVKAIKLPTKK